MTLAPQERRTFFVSSRTAASQPIFRTSQFADLFVDVIRQNREKHRFLVHEFVIMHDHFHMILTPAADQSLEKCVQFLKGGFSFRAKKELGFPFDVWQKSFNEHRIKGVADYRNHAAYIRQNPVRAGYVQDAAAYPYSSASGLLVLDAVPDHLRG